MNNLKLALVNIKKNFKNEKELKSSFLMTILGMAINNTAFIVIWYYFGKSVGIINGWKPMDIFGLYAFSSISYGIVSTFFGGLTNIPTLISSGNFDKYLSTPKSILVKVATSSIHTSAIGDMLFGIICFIVFSISTKITLLQLLISLLYIFITSIIYFSFLLIASSVSFYLMDGENVSKGLHELLLGTSLYHGGAFTGLLRVVFMYVIPSLMISAIPVEAIKSLDIKTIIISIISMIFWYILSTTFFNKSIKKYESNNLFGYGS